VGTVTDVVGTDGKAKSAGHAKVSKPWRRWAKRALSVVIVALALWGTYEHRSEISSAGGMLSRVRVAWLLVAIWAELASMAVFARLQRWLLRAGGVHVAFVPMVEITLAGNAMSTTLPGGAAWSATWSFEQLRRRGAQKTLAGWVILVAGALSSFAVFVILAVGAWVAGSRGPVSSLRWLAAALAAIPLVVSAGYFLARRNHRVRHLLSSAWSAIARHLPPAAALGRLVRKTIDDLGLVHPGPLGWAEAFGLAMANWLFDCLCLLACTEALGVPVHWRALLVIYGLTQVAASLPITPGGIGVVEGSLTALLIAYGTRPTDAVAVVLLYRIVSFWGLAPIGWTVWAGLELAARHGLRHTAHPWADHEHGPEATPEHAALGPDRVVRPSPCMGCDEAAGPGGDEALAGAAGAPAGSEPSRSPP
jgi:putative heme transporter